METLCIFASELGTLLGKNKFKGQEEAIDDIVTRHTTSSRQSQIHEREVEELIVRTPELSSIAQQPLTNKAALDDCVARADALQKARPDLQVACAKVARDARMRRGRMVDDMVKTTPELSDIAHTPIPDRTAQLSCVARAEALAQTRPELKCACDKVIRTVNCSAGVSGEVKVVQKHAIQHNQKVFHKKIDDLGVLLYGRVDGYDEDSNTIVEVKTRKNRLWYRLWPPEEVQLMCYLYMSGASEAWVVERCGDSEASRLYYFDEEEWNRTIIPSLAEAVLKIRACLGVGGSSRIQSP